MKKKPWFLAISDAVGLTGLIGAAITLIGVTRFQGVLPDALMFKLFFTLLGLAVGTFLVSRIAEVGLLAARAPDPRRLRREVPEAATLETLKSAEARSPSLQRAA